MAPALLGAASGSQTTAQTVSSLLPLLGPLLSGALGGGSSSSSSRPRPTTRPRRPPPTTQRPTTTTTQSTTTTTEVPDDRPECPGTCIVPYLSLTCFGNAETTEIFKCKKKNTICCSPKSAVLEEQEKLEDKLQRANLPKQRPMFPPGSPQSLPPLRRNSTNFRDQQQDFRRPQQPKQDKFDPYKNQQRYPDFDTDYDPYTVSQNGGFNVNNNNKGVELQTAVIPVRDNPPLTYPVTNKYECGVKGTYRRQGRVVGGEDGAPGEWCWQVALINSLNQYLCGGALIGKQWVLTAAHCVTNIVRAGDAIYVRVGDHDLTQKFGSPGAQTLRVATTYIHHNHNSQTLDNDIALLKLHGEADLKEGVCLVCLPNRGTSQATGKKCTVTGYGYMGETGPIPLRIREARVPIVNDNECVRKINSVTEKIFILPASSFCAGGEKGHDACQGDGGGPLVCEDSGYHQLTGLVSWGFGCGRKDVPGVYVKVSSFIGWINQIISVNNS